MKILIAVLIAISLSINAQEDNSSDILFLKIQELEGEIANLRSEIETQAYLIEKLLNEEPISGDEISINIEQPSVENTFRFEGINDTASIDEVYDKAISDLNTKAYQAAKKSFTFLANNFNDDEKIPLSLFWLGEISLLESNLEESEEFFQRLIANFPNHWRTPLAHKKIGDILMMSGQSSAAKIKYQYVVQSFPNNSASSLALQLLENME
ncbi:MAG: tol-pal system protein [Gammaproteobacteria bacterium]|nr:tol-pal system protein [Gammaproteobacteria bacterium]|tara:strand:- start:73 stop:705 length:633 start_codon:yes stop_codon:yes gene_type:complete